MFDNIIAFFKSHGYDLNALLAAFMGALIALGFLPQLTLRQSASVLCAGIAVDAYLVPLALHFMSFPATGPLANAIGFLAGLIGMRVIVVIMKWADKVENPADFLHPFKDDKK